jgi:hypothetical protein
MPQTLAMSVFVLASTLLWGTLTIGHDWGDDFAGYILQAVSIVEGRLHEFIETNSFTIFQSSHLLAPVAYPWGLPVMLVPLYAVFGPNPVALKSIGVVFFLFFLLLLWIGFRRYHSDPWRIALVSLFGFNPNFLTFVDSILSDIPFLLVSTFAVLLIGRLVVENRCLISPVYDGILLGMAIAAAFLIRTNGVLLLVTLAFAQLMVAIFKCGTARHWTYILPHLTFLSSALAWNAIFPDATSSYGVQLKELSLELVGHHLIYYLKIPQLFFIRGVPFFRLVTVVFTFLAVIGVISRYRSDYHVVFYVALTFLVYVLWPPTQGLRFMFPVLPFYISFALTSLERYALGPVRTAVSMSPVVFVLSFFAMNSTYNAWENLSRSRVNLSGPYTPVSTEMFSFIAKNTDPESTVVFFKPRLMRLMTGRSSVMINRADELSIGDYLAVCLVPHEVLNDQIPRKDLMRLLAEGSAQAMFANEQFIVFRLNKRGR